MWSKMRENRQTRCSKACWELMELVEVAPHTGAWIETIILAIFRVILYVAPHTGAWIETVYQARILDKDRSRSPYGGVD